MCILGSIEWQKQRNQSLWVASEPDLHCNHVESFSQHLIMIIHKSLNAAKKQIPNMVMRHSFDKVSSDWPYLDLHKNDNKIK